MTDFSDLREQAEATLNARVFDPQEVAALLYQLILHLEDRDGSDTRPDGNSQ
jgi:hypothetical protein